ncbi:FecR family protein [Chitinophaga niastensis]|uniref:FecR family protein n=1 Tax=Chitinophaga niastensis TaxID=536980 RepID=A0A2P8HGW8_CHINA|nr:FecR domain-containing protein [Chitinophaga niastensis]PSL45456.1 FecR family protein [Chitinophaga niastensis]
MAASNYLSFTAREFALDEDFQQWVLHPEEKNVFWEKWLRQYPEMEPVINDARQLVHSIRFRSYSLSATDKEQLWDAVWHGLGEEDEPATVIPVSRWKDAWKYAAAVLLGILLSGGWWWMQQTNNKPVIFSTYTRLGETKSMWLPDSSEVTLNANSRLLYTETDHGKREVWLDGEAFFHVKHKTAQQKFIVHTYDKLSVEVIGTQFNVNSTGKEIVVVLQQGSILLDIGEPRKGKAAELYLESGEMVRYNKQDGDYTKKRVDAARYTSWHSGRLIMDDFTLTDAAAFMQQVFGKTLIVRDTQLLHYKVSGSMPIIYQPDIMMMQLGKVFRMQFNQRGDEIWIQQK